MASNYRVYRAQKEIAGIPEVLCDLEIQVGTVMRNVPVLREGSATDLPVAHSTWQTDAKDHMPEYEGKTLTQWTSGFAPSTHADKNLKGGKLTVRYVCDAGKGERLVLATFNSPLEQKKREQILEQILCIYDAFFKQE